MYFVFGVVDKTTKRRRIISGDATPTVKNMTMLAEDDAGVCDWGPKGSKRAVRRTAALILELVVDAEGAARLSGRFAEDIVAKMQTDKMWMMLYSEIIEWLTSDSAKVGKLLVA